MFKNFKNDKKVLFWILMSLMILFPIFNYLIIRLVSLVESESYKVLATVVVLMLIYSIFPGIVLFLGITIYVNKKYIKNDNLKKVQLKELQKKQEKINKKINEINDQINE